MAKTISSNSKIVKDKIQEYIIDHLLTDETNVLKEQLQIVVDDFNDWYCYHERRKNPNIKDGFCYWLNCLPSIFSLDYYYHEIRKVMEYWLGHERVEKMSDDKMSNMFHTLIYREFKRLCDKNSVAFKVKPLS